MPSACSTRNCSVASSIASRANCRRAARDSIPSVRRATKATPRWPMPCARMTWRFCTIARQRSRSTARARFRAKPRRGTCCSASLRRPTIRSRAGVTRFWVRNDWQSRRKPRPSPATCPRRSARRSASGSQNACGSQTARWPPTAWCSPASATPRPTIRPRRARSTPRCGPPIRAPRCRWCFVARTTASVSRPAPRKAGSPTSSPAATVCTTFTATAPIWSKRIARRKRRSILRARTASRCSSTSARCGFMATPDRTCPRSTSPKPRSKPTKRATRC